MLSDRSKTHGRERYLVTSVDGDYCIVKKFSGPQLWNISYKVKKSECKLLPMFYRHNHNTCHSDGTDSSVKNPEVDSVPHATSMMSEQDLPDVNPTPTAVSSIPDVLITPLDAPSSTTPTTDMQSTTQLNSTDTAKDDAVPYYNKNSDMKSISQPENNEMDVAQDNVVRPPHDMKDNTECLKSCSSRPVRNRRPPTWFQDYIV